MVSGLGGPNNLLEKSEKILPQAPHQDVLEAETSGWVSAIETRQLGLAVVALGGGRKRAEDEIDLAVGLSEVLPVGSYVSAGEPLLRIHAASEDELKSVMEELEKTFVISLNEPKESPLVRERIGEEIL